LIKTGLLTDFYGFFDNDPAMWVKKSSAVLIIN